MKLRAIKHFRIISILEGISFLLLLGVAMPLKYMAGLPDAVKYTGWAHGVLFILFLIYLFRIESLFKMKVTDVVLAGFASLVPFGPFLLEKKLKKMQAEVEAEAEVVI